MYDHDIYHAFDNFGVEYKELYSATRDRRPHTLWDFVKTVASKMPDKVFFVFVTDHFCTVKGDKVLDQRGIRHVEIHWAKRKLVKNVFEIVANNPSVAVAQAAEMSDVIVTNKPRRNPMSKIEQAKTLYANNSSLSRKDMIQLFVKELGIPATTASTYQAVAKKAYVPQTEAPVVKASSGGGSITPRTSRPSDHTLPYNWMGIKDFNPVTWPAELAAEVAAIEAWNQQKAK